MSERPIDSLGTTRVEALVDATFAIAFTILILELHVPEVEPHALGHALLEEWPMFASYLITFANIGVF